MKIAVIAGGASIGDSIISVPVFRNLKALGDITLIKDGKGAGDEINQNSPYIDHVITIPVNSTAKSEQSLIVQCCIIKNYAKKIKAAKTLREEKFDMLIDVFPNTWKTNMLSCISNAKTTIGYGGPLKFLYKNSVTLKNIHWKSVNKSLLEKAGIKNPDMCLELDFLLKQSKAPSVCSTRKKFMAVYVGRGAPGKKWPKEKWLNVLSFLQKQHNIKIIFIGGNDVEKTTKEIIKKAYFNFINLSGKLKLSETAHLIKNASLLLAMEGGLVHMAAALGTPVVSIQGPTKPCWHEYGKNIINLKGQDVNLIKETDVIKACGKLL